MKLFHHRFLFQDAPESNVAAAPVVPTSLDAVNPYANETPGGEGTEWSDPGEAAATGGEDEMQSLNPEKPE